MSYDHITHTSFVNMRQLFLPKNLYRILRFLALITIHPNINKFLCLPLNKRKTLVFSCSGKDKTLLTLDYNIIRD